MTDGKRFVECVKDYFSFLESEFAMQMREEKIAGNVYYDIQYQRDSTVVSISYENIEDYLLVVLFELENGQFPDFDDRSRTHHLSELSSELLDGLAPEEIRDNSQHFSRFAPESNIERQLLESAKSLRLCVSKRADF